MRTMVTDLAEDATLSPDAGRGRDGPFVEFMVARTPSLLRSAFLLTGDQQLAEDLVQDALARTYQAWERLQRVGNATAYTRKTMYHLQVSRWRRRRVAEHLSDEPPEAAAPGRDIALEVTIHKPYCVFPPRSGPRSSCGTSRTSPRATPPRSSAARDPPSKRESGGD